MLLSYIISPSLQSALAFGAVAIDYYCPSMKERLFTSGTHTNNLNFMAIKRQIQNPLNAELDRRNVEIEWLKSDARDQISPTE